MKSRTYEYKRQYYLANEERLKEYQRQYYLAHQEERRAYMRANAKAKYWAAKGLPCPT